MIRDTGVAMRELKIRKDRTSAVLRKLAKAETDVRVARRLLAIANALCGMNRAEAARSAGMDRQTLRDWVIRYNEHGVAGLSDQKSSGRPAMLTLDPLYLYNNTLNPVFDNRPVSLVRDNTVTENVLTGYAMLNLDGTAAGKNVAGSIGVQVVHTKQSSAGTISAFQDTNNDGINEVIVAPASGRTSYTNFLPSASFSIELVENGYIKLGASHTMVRPRLDQERINQEVSFNFSRLTSTVPGDSFFSSNGGNVNLRPYQSTNFDVSAEKYFAKGGYVALAGYYKRLTKFVDARNATLFDFSPALAALPPALAAQVGTPIGAASRKRDPTPGATSST